MKAIGPLRVHPENPRYVADASGKAVLLIGSHTWANFQDIGFEGDKPFDYDEFMDFMSAHHYNFMRFWTWEHSAWATWTAEKVVFGPLPHLRTGPGLALDGKPKFDLDQWDEAYFNRMRHRVAVAGERGVYASVMLFQAFSGIWPHSKDHMNDAFRGHYYNVANNVQGLDGDKDRNSILDIDDPEVRARQAAWIRKVVHTVNDLDNVLYEVINEGGNDDWDRFVIDTVRDCENALAKKHMIGITGHGGVKWDGMLASDCEWISPGSHEGPLFQDVVNDPPAWDGRKVSVLDTDHIWGHGMNYKWVWRSFTRGHNVLFMDPRTPIPGGWPEPPRNAPDFPGYEEGRQAMRNVAKLAARLDLARMTPEPSLASTGFCLAEPGEAYVVYLPDGGEAEVDLRAGGGTFAVVWLAPVRDQIVHWGTIEGGAKRRLRCPFENDCALLLRRM